jgi:hypothetical protein
MGLIHIIAFTYIIPYAADSQIFMLSLSNQSRTLRYLLTKHYLMILYFLMAVNVYCTVGFVLHIPFVGWLIAPFL